MLLQERECRGATVTVDRDRFERLLAVAVAARMWTEEDVDAPLVGDSPLTLAGCLLVHFAGALRPADTLPPP